MQKLLAIDGSRILRLMYEANPNQDSDAKAAEAVKNATTAVLKLLSKHQPTHVLPAFDYGGRTWRHALHPGYQAKRKAQPTILEALLPTLYSNLAESGMSVVSVPELDVEDVIATAVLRWLSEARGEVVIASTGRSLHALIAHGATLWDHFKSESRDRAWVLERYGVEPEMLVDYLALIGDANSGVPGVDKVGHATAMRLLHSFHTLEGIMANVGEIKGALAERLRSGRDRALLSRDLVGFRTNVQLGVTWKRLAIV
jgi:DNA polymerase-1